MTPKIYECAICKKLSKNMKSKITRFKGTRKQVRKHLVEEHHIKGRKNPGRLNKKEFGPSNISQNTIEYNG